jgi:hypothetical protein
MNEKIRVGRFYMLDLDFGPSKGGWVGLALVQMILIIM